MKRLVVTPLLLLIAGAVFVACSGAGGGASGLLVPFLGEASNQDLSGQQSSFTGTLGSGVTSTFPVVPGATYRIQVSTSDSSDVVTVDLWGDDGSLLKSNSLDSGEIYDWTHVGESQHVLLVVRPRNPFLVNMNVTSVTVRATGSFSTTQVHLNVYLAGKFTGLGAFNDLNSISDKAAFTNAVMVKVQSLFAQTGITLTYEGLTYTAAQVSAVNPSLIGTDEQALSEGVETRSSTGFEVVDQRGLDAWGAFGFPASDPDFNRGHGIDVFIINHFTQDGTVGLSPRPGMLVGNGADTALACAAFLKNGSTLFPRSADQIGTVLAHELGHFLGLLHTTTFSPNNVNPSEALDDGLADTPACTVLSDFNGDGSVGLGDGCQDEGNLMFFQAGNQTLFSAQQAGVMQNMLSIQQH